MMLAAGVLALAMGASASARGPIGGRDADYELAVAQAHKRYVANQSGKVSGIPALANVDPNLYAVVVVRVDGKVFEAGDAGTRFALMGGLSAPFAAALLAEQQGVEALSGKLAAAAGLTPLPDARGSADWGKSPTTPLAPKGALTTLGIVLPKGDADAKWSALLGNLSKFAGTSLSLDAAVYGSAKADSKQLVSDAEALVREGRLADDAAATADLYLKQGSVSVTTRELAIMAATLAHDGVNPSTRTSAVQPAVAQAVQQLIAQAGVRGGKSSALNKAKLIATSANSGAILVVVPGRLGIAVYAPPLDSSGVSVRGQQALRYLNQALMLNADPSKP